MVTTLRIQSMDVPSPEPTEPWTEGDDDDWEDIDRVEPLVEDERKWLPR